MLRRSRLTRLAVAGACSLLLALPSVGHADGSDVLCEIGGRGVNVTPSTSVSVVTITGTDFAFGTAVCVSLSGRAYDAWVDIVIQDQQHQELCKTIGSPVSSVNGVAQASNSLTCTYNAPAGTPYTRIHTAYFFVHNSLDPVFNQYATTNSYVV